MSAREAETVPADTEPFEVTVFPNPASAGDINFLLDSNDEQPVEVIMIDFTGREVYRSQFNAGDANQGSRITPDEALIEGIYILKVNQSGKTVMRRVSVKN